MPETTETTETEFGGNGAQRQTAAAPSEAEPHTHGDGDVMQLEVSVLSKLPKLTGGSRETIEPWWDCDDAQPEQNVPVIRYESHAGGYATDDPDAEMEISVVRSNPISYFAKEARSLEAVGPMPPMLGKKANADGGYDIYIRLFNAGDRLAIGSEPPIPPP